MFQKGRSEMKQFFRLPKGKIRLFISTQSRIKSSICIQLFSTAHVIYLDEVCNMSDSKLVKCYMERHASYVYHHHHHHHHYYSYYHRSVGTLVCRMTEVRGYTDMLIFTQGCIVDASFCVNVYIRQTTDITICQVGLIYLININTII